MLHALKEDRLGRGWPMATPNSSLPSRTNYIGHPREVAAHPIHGFGQRHFASYANMFYLCRVWKEIS